jgi:hypothetical protein
MTVETRILKSDRGLRRQHLQDGDAVGREHTRGQVALQVGPIAMC